MVRAFIAVDLPVAVRDNIRALQSVLSTAGVKAKWVEPANIHLTVVFLGNVVDDAIPDVVLAMDQSIQEYTPFEFGISGLGWFGSVHSPRIVWAGTDDGISPLINIQKGLCENLQTLELTFDDRPFKPHLTLARVKSRHGANRLIGLIRENQDIQLGSVPVERLVLYSSQLTSAGPIYTNLHESVL